MHWAGRDRAHRFDELDEEVELRPQEIQMARSLIDSLTEDFQPEEFHDEYRAALEDVIAMKAQGQEVTFVEEAEPSEVVDLMQALQASVGAARSSRPSEDRAARASPRVEVVRLLRPQAGCGRAALLSGRAERRRPGWAWLALAPPGSPPPREPRPPERAMTGNSP